MKQHSLRIWQATLEDIGFSMKDLSVSLVTTLQPSDWINSAIAASDTGLALAQVKEAIREQNNDDTN